MIYILDHYYTVNHEKYCVIVKSDKFIQDIIEIYSAIEFLLEEIVDEGALLEERCLLKILEDFYEAKNIKDLFSDEELSLIDMPIDGLYMGTVVSYGQMVADEACHNYHHPDNQSRAASFQVPQECTLFSA